MNKEKRLNNFAGEIKIGRRFTQMNADERTEISVYLRLSASQNSLPTASLDEITGIIIGAALCGERLLR